MTALPARVRKGILTAHVVASVGWLGAVIAFVYGATIVIASENPQLVRAAYLTMDGTASLVLLPLAVASLLTGVAQALVTPWGLFRHYWIVVKLAINLLATIVLLAYLQTLSGLRAAAETAASTYGTDTPRSASPALHAVAALGLLLLATILAVYKPRGLTPYGVRKLREQRQRHERSPGTETPAGPSST